MQLILRQASNIIDGNAEDEAGGETGGAAEAETSGGLADLAESIADAVENATTEIFNATQVNCLYIFISEKKLFQMYFLMSM